MIKKNLVDIEAADRLLQEAALPTPEDTQGDIPRDDEGNPMILPPEVWQKTVVNLKKLKYPVKRGAKRIDCYGDAAFFNKNDMIIAIGEMRKISRKGACFEIYLIDSNIRDIAYLEFFNLADFILNQIKVDIRVGYLSGTKPLLGVEFTDPTRGFQEKLDKFIAVKKAEMGVFDELEDI